MIARKSPRAFLLWGALSSACSTAHPHAELEQELGDAGMPLTCEDGASSERKVDLLFVIDNSGSMGEEQQALAAQLPRIVRALATGDLEDGGSRADFERVTSLHLGVVSTDMGTDGAYSLNGQCEGKGDDGILLDEPAASAACKQAVAAGNYLSYTAGDDGSAEDSAAVLACTATLGSAGSSSSSKRCTRHSSPRACATS